MPTHRPLPFVATLDDCDSPADVIDLMALERFIAGAEPAACTAPLNRLRGSATLLPPGVSASWTAIRGGLRAHLARGEGWTLRAVRWADDSGEVTVTATDEALARRILAAATADAIEPEGPEGTTVRVGFWHLKPNASPRRVERQLDIEPWDAIARNYSARPAAALDAVMRMEPGTLSGRLLLVHGPPGTGKTTALRAVAHAWRSWCRLEVVLDPDRFLVDPSYLLRVVVGDGDGDDDDAPGQTAGRSGPRWRLVVLEDCDELIRADAKSGTGQALARLLNLADGMLGQGMRVLIAITTNEPLQSLHPAIVRPGRCAAEIAVGRLTRAEAVQWLGRADGIGAEGATLAELLARRGQLHKVETRPLVAVPGQYL